MKEKRSNEIASTRKRTSCGVLQLQHTYKKLLHALRVKKQQKKYQPCRLNTWLSLTSSFPVKIQEKRENNDKILKYM